MIDAKTFTDIEKLALAKAMPEAVAKAARAAVDVGRHEIDMVVRLQGSVVVNPPTSRAASLTQGDYSAFVKRMADKHPKEFMALCAEYLRDPARFRSVQSPFAEATLEQLASKLPDQAIAGQVRVDAVNVQRLGATDLEDIAKVSRIAEKPRVARRA